MNAELSQLLSLQEIDLELRRLNEEIVNLPIRQQQLEARFIEANREFLDLQNAYDLVLAQRQELEQTLADEQTKQEKFKADLMKATNEREYSTALREIDVAKKAISGYETEILKLMETAEKLAAEVAQRTPEIADKRAELEQQLKDIEAAVTADQAKVAALTVDRQQSFETLSSVARATYQRLSRMRNGVVLAEARDGSCQGCRMRIRPQTFHNLKRAEQLFECESCGRILYYRATASA